MLFRKFDKKGNVEVQFNWIFVILIGTMLLVFFVSLANKSTDAADSKLNLNIVNSFNNYTFWSCCLAKAICRRPWQRPVT